MRTLFCQAADLVVRLVVAELIVSMVILAFSHSADEVSGTVPAGVGMLVYYEIADEFPDSLRRGFFLSADRDIPVAFVRMQMVFQAADWSYTVGTFRGGCNRNTAEEHGKNSAQCCKPMHHAVFHALPPLRPGPILGCAG